MIRFENVTKSFNQDEKKINAINNISMEINEGEIFGIIGFSGAGKSTLLRCINLLERPDEGSIFLNGRDLTKLRERELRKERKNIGMIFQQFNLLSQRNVLQNVCYPLEISGVKKREAVERARELLRMVGLEDKENSYPVQLSGGQKQRVAIARALATKPKVLLCDEPTSALDPNTTNDILNLLSDINKKLNVTIVIITHEMKVIEKICDRVAILNEGNLEEIGEVKNIFEGPKSKTGKRLILNEYYEICEFSKNNLRLIKRNEQYKEAMS